MALTSRHELNLTLTLKHKFYLDLKKLKFIFKSMLILCLFMSKKLLMDGQTKTIEPHKKCKIKKCLHIRVALKLT